MARKRDPFRQAESKQRATEPPRESEVSGLTKTPGTRRSKLRELFAIDLRSLAVFRVAIALVLLLDLGIRASDLGAMYTDHGMFSRATIARHYSDWSWSFHFGSGSISFEAMLFGVAAFFGSALLLGFRTRLATIASWLLLLSLQNRVPPILTGADNLLRMLLFWSIFLPLGGVWSVDAHRASRRAGEAAESERVLSVASAAILLQMGLLYFFSALFKTNADWTHGEALRAILSDEFYTKPLAAELLESPRLLHGLTLAILLIEWIGPFLLFSPFRTSQVRLGALVVLAAMHVGVEIFLDVGLFSLVSFCGLLLFLPPPFWRRVTRWSPAAPTASDSRISAKGISPTRTPSLGSYAANALCALVFVYVVFLNLNDLPSRFLPWTPKPKNDFLNLACGFGQKWDMFSEAPSGSGWYVAEAILVDGTRVDLLRDGAPVSFEKPGDPTALYPNHRWQKCFREIAYADTRGYQVFREPVAEYLCRDWNRRNAAEKQVSEFSLILCAEREEKYGVPITVPTRQSLVHLDLARREATR